MNDHLRAALEDALGSAYDLGRELTGGGMSRVFVATERALGRPVVVKVLPPELAAGVNRDRFRREVQLAARLQHPHVVPLLTAGEHGDLLYYTMPFIEGESLRALMAARGQLSVRDVVRIVHDVAEALAYAHARGVIHRDIKPGNILMLGSHALVTDFGVAKALSAALPHSGTTSVGVAVGTPAYMAPEQLAADPAADHRVDLYALGLVAYELLTGASPFAAPSPRETLTAQLTRVPDPVELVRPEVPAALSALVMRCLEKSPDLRPPDAESVLATLETLVAGQVGGQMGGSGASDPQLRVGAASPAGPTTPITPPAPPTLPGSTSGATGGAMAGAASGETAAATRGTRRWAVLALAAVVVAGLGAGGALALRALAGPPERETGGPLGVTVPLAALDSVRDTTVAADARATAAEPTPPATPRPLTREDSLAIAAAVRERLEPTTPVTATGPRLDSLMVMVERMIADSISHALHESRRWTVSAGRPTPPSAPRVGGGTRPADAVSIGRRVVALGDVENATGNRALDPAAAALGASLHGALAADRELRVFRVPEGAARGEVRVRTLRDSLDASTVVRPLLTMRGDSVVSLVLLVTDTRRGQVLGTISGTAPASDPSALLTPQLLARLRAVLVQRTPIIPPQPRRAAPAEPPASR